MSVCNSATYASRLCMHACLSVCLSGSELRTVVISRFQHPHLNNSTYFSALFVLLMGYFVAFVLGV